MLRIRDTHAGSAVARAPLTAALSRTALTLAATTSPPAPNPQPAAEPIHRRAARYAWAVLLARIYELFPLGCPLCGAAMRIIAFITDIPNGRAILAHLGEPTAPPRIAPARGPPLGEHLRSPRPAGTGVRVRSTHRLVTLTVDRQPRATLRPRMPAAAGHATRTR